MLRYVGLAAVAVVATTAGGRVRRPRRAAAAARPDAHWTTVFKPPAGVGIEGLTADRRGDLYTPGRGVVPCPVFRVRGDGAVVGNLPGPCNPAGLAFGPDGRLYIADTGRIMVLRPERRRAADGDGLRDRRAGLQRRRLRPPRRPLGDRRRDRAGPRVADRARRRRRRRSSASSRWPTTWSPAASAATCAGCRPGRSRSPRPAARRRTRSAPSTWWPTASRSTTTATLYVADTARGAIWRVRLDHRGRVAEPDGLRHDVHAPTRCAWTRSWSSTRTSRAPTGSCSTTTRTSSSSANERNSIAVVTDEGRAVEYFRNPRRRDAPAQRGPARVPDQPGARAAAGCA